MPDAPVIKMVGGSGAETVLVAILLLDYLRLNELTYTHIMVELVVMFGMVLVLYIQIHTRYGIVPYNIVMTAGTIPKNYDWHGDTGSL